MGVPSGRESVGYTYEGVFGFSGWSGSSHSRTFSSVPNTNCCGFGLVVTNDYAPGMYLDEPAVEAFLQKAHFSGFLIRQRKRCPLTMKDGLQIAGSISARHVGVFTVHWFMVEEPDLQMYTMEIHDVEKFEKWRTS
jgi:hypothetical protein